MYGQYLIYIQQYRPQIKHHYRKHAALQTNTYHLRLNPLKTKRPSASKTPRVCPLHVDLAEGLGHLADALIAQWNPDEAGRAWSAKPAESGGFSRCQEAEKKNLLVLNYFGCKYWIQASVVIRKPQMHFDYIWLLFLQRGSYLKSKPHGHSNDKVTMTFGLMPLCLATLVFQKGKEPTKMQSLRKPKGLWPPPAWQM